MRAKVELGSETTPEAFCFDIIPTFFIFAAGGARSCAELLVPIVRARPVSVARR